MQIAQAEHMRLIDYHGVGVRDIYAVFYYRSRYQDIIITSYEIQHPVFQKRRLHLPVAGYGLGLRTNAVYHLFQGRQVLNSVMDEENLSSAIQLVVYCFPYVIFIEIYDLSLYRKPVWRRSVDDGKVSCSQQRELQGTRNRSSCKCQSINFYLKLSQPFLGGYSELLFLVYYQQTQVFELYALVQKPVGSYDNVYFSGSYFLGNLPYVLCTAES